MKVLAWPAFKTRYKNPYNWLLYSPMQSLGVEVEEFSAQKLLLQQHDIIHLHWPVETITRHPNRFIAQTRVSTFLTLLKLARWRGARIVWTMHDEQPHVLLHPDLAQQCEVSLMQCVDAVIHLCETTQQAILQKTPDLKHKPNFVIPHGHYQEAYPNQVTSSEAKAWLNLPPDKPTLLFLGYISPYKNVSHLVECFRQLSDAHLALVIAGKPDTAALEEAILKSAAGDSRVHTHLRFIPDEQLQFFYNAADLVVLPFQEILNSGSTLMALSYNRPVLVPHLGALPEWQRKFGSTWVKTYQGTLTSKILVSALQELADRKETTVPLASLDWSSISKRTVDVYRQISV